MKFPHSYGADVNLTFNMNINKMLTVYIKCIPNIEVNKEPGTLSSYYMDMIIEPWGLFYSKVEENIQAIKIWKMIIKINF